MDSNLIVIEGLDGRGLRGLGRGSEYIERRGEIDWHVHGLDDKGGLGRD